MVSIDEIIAESSYETLAQTYWMQRDIANMAVDQNSSGLWSVTSDGVETTRVVASTDRPSDFAEGYGPLTAFRFRVSRPFAAPGFLAAACSAIASTNVAVLIISTFTFDYVFVRQGSALAAEDVLRARGFRRSN